MKNKEIEELLNKLKTILKNYKELKVEPTLCEELITTGELNLLLSYIEQLENNRDKAIEEIKYLIGNFDIIYYKGEKIINILKGDSDEK